MVQIYFAWRIWAFKRGNIVAQMLAVLIVLIALMQSLSAIVNGIRVRWCSLCLASFRHF